MKYRLGLDMGATSIGWSVFDMERDCLLDAGVRIFDDGREDKSKASLCVKRRTARGARRLNNRRHIKMRELLKVLISLGLFPNCPEEKSNLKKLDPYELRKRGLDERLELYEFGRVLMQLAKRKGFKSGRKDNREEGGKLKKGFDELREEMQKNNARTYGEFLYMQRKNYPDRPIRLRKVFDDNGKFLGGLFPFREVYQNEFDMLWNKQKEYYPEILTESNRGKIKDIIFFQRPLKEQEEGECRFEKGEKCLPKAHPLFQEFRIWQSIMNLTYASEFSTSYAPLGKEKNKELADLLLNPEKVKPSARGIVIYKNIKKALGLNVNGTFNFEKGSNDEFGQGKGLLVNTTQAAINKTKYLLSFWNGFSDEQKGLLIDVIFRPSRYINFPKGRLSQEDEDAVIQKYLCQNFGLSEEATQELLYDVCLEDGYASLSAKAVRKILSSMKQGMQYSDACLDAGYHHSDKTYDSLPCLPYYGEILTQNCLGKKTNPQSKEEKYGKINNATVHVALNQVRHLVNELIEKYGKPFDLAVEYARDLSASAEERKKMTAKRDENERENDNIRKELIGKIGSGSYSKRDIQKYKIWKKLSWYNGDPLTRECPFSGKPISLTDLLNGQKFQIEHLIPFSRSLDDSLDNKVLSSVQANVYKGNRTPYEAFGQSKDGYKWNEILQRAKNLSIEQQWRFAPDAMEKFAEKEGPIARSLNDTRYMTRLLQDYLQPIVRPDGKQRVQAVVGQLTSLIRKSWGLNIYKDKDDEEAYRAFHNHHAVDAIIVSAISRFQIAEAARQLKTVPSMVIDKFKDEFYKLKDENVSAKEKQDLKKQIKDFEMARKEAVINQYFPMPKNMNVPDVLDRVSKIYISHKPSLKNIHIPHSTIGKLHEDSAYGLKEFVDKTSLAAVFSFNKKQITKNITDYIPMFYNKEDKKVYYDAYKEWFVADKKASTLIISSKADKLVKEKQSEKERKTIQKLREAAQKAFKWFIGGGNFCAEVYEINPQNKICGLPTKDRSEWKIEIVSNYNATIRKDRGENVAYWRYKYPNAKRIMSLRRNDMVMATFKRKHLSGDKFPKGLQDYVKDKFEQNHTADEIDVLFRVKKMTNGIVYLTPHDIAKEEHDTKSWIASAGSLQLYRARKVFVSFTGRICHAK